MIRHILFAACVLLISTASAQRTLRGSSPLFLDKTADGWESVSPSTKECMRQELASRGQDLSAQIRLGLSPSSPTAKWLMDKCAPAPDASIAEIDQFVVDFADWFNSQVLSRPQFVQALTKCREIISMYQDRILMDLNEAALAATSKKEQQIIQERLLQLREQRSLVMTSACMKQFIGSLDVAGPSGGSPLTTLEAVLQQKRIDMVRTAAAKFDDLTDRGLDELLSSFALATVTKADIERRTGYPMTLLPFKWTRPQSDPHLDYESFLDRKITGIAERVNLP